MAKLNVCVLFGGSGRTHSKSACTAQAVLTNLDREKYNIFPVGITHEGDWYLYGGTDYSKLPTGEWLNCPENRKAAISPIPGQGLLIFEGDCAQRELIEIVFPVLHDESSAVQGLLQLAGIPYVGSGMPASVVAEDHILTKLMADNAGIAQADWQLVRGNEVINHMQQVISRLEAQLRYPMLVKSESVFKADDRQMLIEALTVAARTNGKILVEALICGCEIAVAVMGKENPVASVCGEVDTSENLDGCIPARISEEMEEYIREQAVQIYAAVGCRGLSRVDFIVADEGKRVLFNRFNPLPSVMPNSMYSKLFSASGIAYNELIDHLLQQTGGII